MTYIVDRAGLNLYRNYATMAALRHFDNSNPDLFYGVIAADSHITNYCLNRHITRPEFLEAIKQYYIDHGLIPKVFADLPQTRSHS